MKLEVGKMYKEIVVDTPQQAMTVCDVRVLDRIVHGDRVAYVLAVSPVAIDEEWIIRSELSDDIE